MSYVDGFVLPIPKKNLAAYKKLARLACRVWMEHGALQYVEAVGDDLDTEMGLPYPKAVKLKKGETVVFAFVTYKSRAHRDRVNKKVMKDRRILESCHAPMPFDPKRMQYGGFKSLVES